MVLAKEWFTVEEAAEYLGISRRTIYKLTKEGRLPAFRIGRERHRRFKKADLDKVLSPLYQEHPVPAISARDDPVLAKLWDNELDAIYDSV